MIDTSMYMLNCLGGCSTENNFFFAASIEIHLVCFLNAPVQHLYWLRRVLVTEQNDSSGLSSFDAVAVAVDALPLIVYVAMHDADGSD